MIPLANRLRSGARVLSPKPSPFHRCGIIKAIAVIFHNKAQFLLVNLKTHANAPRSLIQKGMFNCIRDKFIDDQAQ